MFRIIDVSEWPVLGDEPMGSKPKCWLSPCEGEKWLFKQKIRPNSGDDWSEKVASELAELFGLPHAYVELASRNGQRGVIARDLVTDLNATDLIPGNRLLVEADQEYPHQDRYHLAQHTVERVFAVLTARSVELPSTVQPAPEIGTANDLFAGYLLFDAWIGNTDRHHENWAVMSYVGESGTRMVLSPSYDHASSLGHGVTDPEREIKLTTKDSGRNLPAYARKARSAFCPDESTPKALLTDAAFQRAAGLAPAAGSYWIDRLRRVSLAEATDIVTRIPSAIMTDWAKRFAQELVGENQRRLLELSR
jgi:hypothetical protein